MDSRLVFLRPLGLRLDEAVKAVVDAVLEVNSTGTPGDGKIFVLPVEEVYRVRDGQVGS